MVRGGREPLLLLMTVVAAAQGLMEAVGESTARLD